MFINFVIQNLPDQELYPASQRKSQDCWSLNDASIEIYSQVSKVEALAREMTETPRTWYLLRCCELAALAASPWKSVKESSREPDFEAS